MISKHIRSLLIILFYINIHILYSQTSIAGKVVDSDNRASINHVKILNIKTNELQNTDNDGFFKIPQKGTYKFSKIGYQDKEVIINNFEYLIVELSLNPLELNDVLVNAHLIPQKLKNSVATIDIITSTTIKNTNSTNFNTILNQVPGIYMQSGSLNTNKISIRGIGSRNLYGTSKIRAYYKDIPLTNGNGETTIEDFELSSISRLEIIKGAASSIYGAGLGGTIHLIPKNSFLNQTIFESDYSIGSFGLSKSTINMNIGNQKNSFRSIYSNTESDGYRQNNKYKRQTFTYNSNHYLNKNNLLTFLASYVDLKSFIPSSINEDDFNNNPKSAAFTWKQSKGYEDSQRGILGISWEHDLKSNIKQITSVFSSFNDAYEPRPFNVLTEKTFALGIRTRLLIAQTLFKKELKWTFGAELFKDTYKNKTFENLYKDFPEDTGSVKGDQLSNFKEKRTYYNIFFETNYNISEKTKISVGLNFNKTNYTLKDKFITSDDIDKSGSYSFNDVLSPKFGLSHAVSENMSLYSNISHGFSPPTTQETLLPDGLINTNIKPETGWNYEIGWRSSLIDNRLQLNLAVYRLAVKNLLVARRTSSDQFIGLNAGKTQHDGLELSSNYKWLRSKNLLINQFFSYTLNHFIFKEFIDANADYSGNKLTGVPSNIFNSRLDLTSSCGVYGTISYQHVGKIPITDNNAIFTENYNLTNIIIGYKLNVVKNLTLNYYFGLDNIFDEHYASQVLINALGFGGNAPRYYYPGNPINYFTGINLNYLF